MIIEFVYGERQQFRYRHQDINIIGRLHAAAMPVRRATYRLNDSAPVAFYVEHVPDLSLRAGANGGWYATPIDWRIAYKDSRAGLRLKRLGDFNIEIPIDSPELVTGQNRVRVEIEDHGKIVDRAAVEFSWDPTPVPLPLDLSDLSGYRDVQELAQVADGLFAIDPARNVIHAETPADPDSLLLLGSPHASQEATYQIVFHQPNKAKYLGLSDYFVRHEAEDPPIGIKPGYSTAGLATVKFDGEARAWISFGDNAHRAEGWVKFTEPPSIFHAQDSVPYRVRHQVIFEQGHNRARFRIWLAGEPEPETWLCDEDDSGIVPSLPRFTQATFGLFQHTGVGSEWSDIRVTALEHAGG
ncbi:MAG: hypothetical protein U0521_23885 [Anaerolineae bacterium]